ncbi:DNA gyrase inhibitor YacG [Pararhodobacter oceanensis]|nr:DNA gyrase inhibitor YacG [Pararhodobacter oceanensis]
MSAPATKAPRCPNCGKAAVDAHKPFCSKRCADVDLARWLRGDYVIPGPDGEAEGEIPEHDPRDPQD